MAEAVRRRLGGKGRGQGAYSRSSPCWAVAGVPVSPPQLASALPTAWTEAGEPPEEPLRRHDACVLHFRSSRVGIFPHHHETGESSTRRCCEREIPFP